MHPVSKVAAALASLHSVWVGTWLSQAQPHAFARVTLGGNQIRLHLTNPNRAAPLKIASVHVALSAGEEMTRQGSSPAENIMTRQGSSPAENIRTVPASDHEVRFKGQRQLLIPAGGEALSDPIALSVPNFGALAISASASPNTSPNILDEIDVFLSGGGCSALVISNAGNAGDTPSENAAASPSSNDTNERWPDFLAKRFIENALPVSVLTTTGESLSPALLERSGVCALIIAPGAPDTPGTPSNLIRSIRKWIERAHSKGLFVIGATLPPFGGSRVDSPARERLRLTLNRWIRDRRAHHFDSIADFDLASREPSSAKDRGKSARLRPDLDSGDHIHMNGLGEQALAETVDLTEMSNPGIRRNY